MRVNFYADCCVLGLHPIAKVSEEVNRKCPPRNTAVYNIRPPTPTQRAAMYSITDRETNRQTDGRTTVSCQ